MDALDSLQQEMESAFARLNAKLSHLRLTLPDGLPSSPIDSAPPLGPSKDEKEQGSKQAELEEEPPALRPYLRSADAHDETRYASAAVRRSTRHESDTVYRLRGRWMQLSTHCAFFTRAIGFGDIRKSLLNRTMSKTKSEGEIARRLESLPFLSRPLNPESTFRICWDLASLVLLLVDAIVLPLSIAWYWDMGFGRVSSYILSISVGVSVVFWTLDIILNLNTAVYIKGQLVHDRSAILKRYLSTWFVLDISLVSLDYLNMAQDLNLSWLRFGRIFRAFRMLRLLKMTKLDEIIQELAASTGRQWIMLVIAILTSAIAATLVTHFITCIWFWIGYTIQQQEEALQQGRESWILKAGAWDQPGGTQYIHSLRYVMNSPAPPTIAPESWEERLVDIMNNLFVLVVIGNVISKISGTMAELRAMNEARSRQRREIRVYLSNQDASFELVSRIMKFVEYKLEKMTPVTFDSSLISKTLQTELYMSQRGEFLEVLPIFHLTKEVFPDSFAAICACLKKHVFESKERVFSAGAVATSLFITVAGKFVYMEVEDAGKEQLVQGGEWFEELALYAEGLVHHSTLSSKAFSEVLSLHNEDFIDNLQNSPDCASMFCEYAKEFIDGMRKNAMGGHQHQLYLSQYCCGKTKIYQEMFPDSKTRLMNIRLFPTELEELPDTFELEPLDVGDESGALPRMPGSGLLHYLQSLSGESLELDLLETALWTHLPELNRHYGAYIVFDQVAERDRADSACLSLVALVWNRYDLFVKPQVDETTRLTPAQWDQLQDILSWTKPSHEQIHAALVLLAIRGLGKSVHVQSQSECEGHPEQAVRYLVDNARNVVPSIIPLSDTALHCLCSVLEIHEIFNLAQMLQGENVPASVAQVQEKIAECGPEVFNCYILFLLGFMSGIAGGRGSKFLTARTAPSFIASLQVFSQLTKLTPRSVYWGYLRARAGSFQSSFTTAEDLALVRLACLSRVQGAQSFLHLQTAWSGLSNKQRGALVSHLLADGITRQAMIFIFLPDCIQKSMANPTVGLTVLLEVLVDLLAHLQVILKEVPNMQIWIDLSDLAEFAAAVQNNFVFQTCISRCKVDVPQPIGKRAQIQLQMTSANWLRIQEVETDLMSVSHRVSELLKRQQWLEAYLTNAEAWGV